MGIHTNTHPEWIYKVLSIFDWLPTNLILSRLNAKFTYNLMTTLFLLSWVNGQFTWYFTTAYLTLMFGYVVMSSDVWICSNEFGCLNMQWLLWQWWQELTLHSQRCCNLGFSDWVWDHTLIISCIGLRWVDDRDCALRWHDVLLTVTDGTAVFLPCTS